MEAEYLIYVGIVFCDDLLTHFSSSLFITGVNCLDTNNMHIFLSLTFNNYTILIKLHTVDTAKHNNVMDTLNIKYLISL
jgi:hypothetical protein